MSKQAHVVENATQLNGRRSIPVVQSYSTVLGTKERRRLSRLANKLLSNEPALSSTAHFGSAVKCGLHATGPALLLADQSEISLYGPPETALLEYRVAGLAEAGDMLVLSHGRCAAFEAYLSEFLGIAGIDVLSAASSPVERYWSLPKRCLQNSALFQHIASTATNAGQLSIVPCLSTGHVWNLARRIGEETSVNIAVTAPPPRLARRINDKVWFANRVKQVLGQQALTPAASVYGPAALVGHVQRMVSVSDRLVVKLPDSAGSTGNLTFETETFRNCEPWRIRQQLLEMLRDIGWQGSFPLKIELWESPILSNPSAQIWIPEPSDGLPVIEGLYEQVVESAGGKFIGAIKSHMPYSMQNMMAQQVMKLAFLFQQLGYFGRCSMDAIVTGASYATANLHWIECNGRWGGVSVPMTLLSRLTTHSQNCQVMIVQKLNLEMPPRPFQTAIDVLDGLLFRRGRSDEGVVLLTPTSYEQGVGVHYMALARTLGAAREIAGHAMRRLTENDSS